MKNPLKIQIWIENLITANNPTHLGKRDLANWLDHKKQDPGHTT
jgi:hypothetical protein